MKKTILTSIAVFLTVLCLAQDTLINENFEQAHKIVPLEWTRHRTEGDMYSTPIYEHQDYLWRTYGLDEISHQYYNDSQCLAVTEANYNMWYWLGTPYRIIPENKDSVIFSYYVSSVPDEFHEYYVVAQVNNEFVELAHFELLSSFQHLDKITIDVSQFENECIKIWFVANSNGLRLISIDDVQLISYDSPSFVENVEKNDYKVYPTIVYEHIWAIGTGKKNINVFNTTGVLVKQIYSNNDKSKIDLSSLTSGMYIVAINEEFTQKIIKK